MENDILLNDIMDDINIESASKVINIFETLSKTFDTMIEIEETIKTENPDLNLNLFLSDIILTTGYDKKYFGFDENITYENAKSNISDINSTWKKVWVWIKNKLKDIKDWILKVINSIFNKNKTILEILNKFEKINLQKPKTEYLETETILNISSFIPVNIPKYILGLNFYNSFYKEIIFNLNNIDFVSDLTKGFNQTFNSIKAVNIYNDLNTVLKCEVKNEIFTHVSGDKIFYKHYEVDKNNKVFKSIKVYDIEDNIRIQSNKKYKTLNSNDIYNIIKLCKKNISENISLEESKLNNILGKLNVALSDNPENIKIKIEEDKGIEIGKISALINMLENILLYINFQHKELNHCVKYLALNIKNY